MKKFCIVAVILFIQSLNAQDLSEQLYNLPHVIFKKIETPTNFEAAYELNIKQPLDHDHPEKGYFYQKAYLSHKNFDAPIVLVTNGYHLNSNQIAEPTSLLSANQISVEHRYFGESKPDSLDYNFLNLKQITADLHRINKIFREIYAGKWVSTGISKGGQTTLFYRYFYPEDVTVSIPYVAPSTQGLEDPRIYNFLDTVGSEECRTKITSVQKKILQERETVLPLLKWYAYGANLKFNYLTFEEAFEYAVLEYPFSFWQWGADCDHIPDLDGDIDKILFHFVSISDLDFFADNSMENYASHYYQAGSEMGYYGYEIAEFKDLLKALPVDKNPSAVFMPNKMKVKFNNDVPIKMQEWIKTKGDRIIYINGNKDTWSATAERPRKNVDALWFFLKDRDHGAARIKNMTNQERAKMVAALERWLEMEIE